MAGATEGANKGMSNTSAGTAPGRHALDLGNLAQYMRGHVPGFSGTLEAELLKGGQSNPTFLLKAGGERYVLRRKPLGKLLPSAHAVDREYRIITALRDTDVPVPRTYALCEDDSAIGSAFYIMAYVDGRVLWDPSLPGMSPRERAAVFSEMNRVIAAIHLVDYKAIGLEDYGRPGGYFERQIGRWSKQYRASETGRNEDMEKLMVWLAASVPAQERTSIVHGDYRLDNMILHPTEQRVAAVLDWELATLGEPLADFTHLLMNWFNGGVATVKDLMAHGIPTADEYVAEYCRLTNRAGLPDLNWYFAYSSFRLAAILQGIAGRVRDGTANSPLASAQSGRVPGLAAAAVDFARKAGADF